MKKVYCILLALLFLTSCGKKETVPAETTSAQTEATSETQEPVTAPDITLYDEEGNIYQLADFFGKPIVLNFWASWCGPCRNEMPHFEEAYLREGENVHFLMVNLVDGETETVDTAASFISKQGYSFPVYFDMDGSAANTYQVSTIPMTWFINAEGHLVAYANGSISADLLGQGLDMIRQ